MGSTVNLVDRIWPNRPPRPNEPAKVLPIEYTGKSIEEKLKDLRKSLDKKKAAGMIVCKTLAMRTRRVECSLIDL